MPVQTPLLSPTPKGYLERVNYIAKLKASWNKLVFQAKNNKFKYAIYWQTQIKHELYSLSVSTTLGYQLHCSYTDKQIQHQLDRTQLGLMIAII